MKTLAHAKINLGLRVVSRRDDGYHNIETVFLRIDWADVLTDSPSDTFSFRCSDPSLPVDESNLVVGAVRVFEAEAGVSIHRRVVLEKVLPYGAGLGGGSSDAAAVLKICASVAEKESGIVISAERLHVLAASLGADVPFFLTDATQVGSGTGTTLEPLLDGAGSPYEFPFWIVVVAPDIHVSSADAYRLVAPRPLVAGEETPGEIVLSNDLRQWSGQLVNDFEPTVLDAFPQIRRVKYQLQDHGAGYASMSGSGSTVFGLFESPAAAGAAFESLSDSFPDGYRMWMGRAASR